MQLLLAPMEGLLDFVLRDVLTRIGGVDRCVSEFIRVSGSILPDRVFLSFMPELLNGSKTLAGVPPITQWSGKCFPVTIAPVAMILWLPIRAPLSTFTEWPIHTWLPTVMSADGFLLFPVTISNML